MVNNEEYNRVMKHMECRKFLDEIAYPVNVSQSFNSMYNCTRNPILELNIRLKALLVTNNTQLQTHV